MKEHNHYYKITKNLREIAALPPLRDLMGNYDSRMTLGKTKELKISNIMLFVFCLYTIYANVFFASIFIFMFCYMVFMIKKACFSLIIEQEETHQDYHNSVFGFLYSCFFLYLVSLPFISAKTSLKFFLIISMLSFFLYSFNFLLVNELLKNIERINDFAEDFEKTESSGDKNNVYFGVFFAKKYLKKSIDLYYFLYILVLLETIYQLKLEFKAISLILSLLFFHQLVKKQKILSDYFLSNIFVSIFFISFVFGFSMVITSLLFFLFVFYTGIKEVKYSIIYYDFDSFLYFKNK